MVATRDASGVRIVDAGIAAPGSVAAGLVILWATSSYWYFTEVRFGF